MYSFVECAGISEMDTIVAATKVGAEMLKVDDVTGTLEAGKSADLLVIEAILWRTSAPSPWTT